MAQLDRHHRHHPEVSLSATAGRSEGRPPPAGPLKDAQRAVSLVRSKAKEWGIDPNKIGMVGFSAGGHLVGSTCTNFEKRSLRRRSTTSTRSVAGPTSASCAIRATSSVKDGTN